MGLFSEILSDLIETKSAHDSAVGLLHVLARKENQNLPRIGAKVLDTDGIMETDGPFLGTLNTGQIVNIVGDKATVFINQDPNFKGMSTNIARSFSNRNQG